MQVAYYNGAYCYYSVLIVCKKSFCSCVHYLYCNAHISVFVLQISHIYQQELNSIWQCPSLNTTLYKLQLVHMSIK